MKQDWAGLFETHGRDLYRFAYRLSGSRELAEDAVQECFVSLMKSAKPIPLELRAYLFGAVRNLVFKALNRPATLPVLSDPTTPPDQSSDVHAMLLRLPQDAREALVLISIEGFTYEEAGRLLNVDPATLRVRVHRARRQLKQELGYEVTTHD